MQTGLIICGVIALIVWIVVAIGLIWMMADMHGERPSGYEMAFAAAWPLVLAYGLLLTLKDMIQGWL